MGIHFGGRWPLVKRLALIIVVFLLGLFIGDGRLSIHHNRSVVASGLPSQLNYSSVNQVYQVLKDNYDGQLTVNQLLDGLKHGLAESTNDPYTEYFTASEAKNFNSELNNSFSGIGAELGADSSGNLEVISPINGSPAAKAGLKAGDIITAINGSSTAGLSVDGAVNKIRGPAGSKVSLQIIRGNSTVNFTITRDNIQLPSVTNKTLPGNLGYIDISSFSSDTSSLATQVANQLKGQNVKGIILDLRNDPGGLLDAAVHVSSLWLNPGQKVIDEKRGSQVVDTSYALGGNVLKGIPTVVLINGGSASASEITAGALHDNKDAYIIGNKSFGKGVVQDIICINGQTNSDGSCPSDELKVTIASWYRPDGKNINHQGITPDKTVNTPDNTIGGSGDLQLQAAESYLTK